MYRPAKPAPITTASTSSVEVVSASALLVCVLFVVCRCAASVVSEPAPVRAWSWRGDAGPHRLDHLLEAALAAGQQQDREEAVGLPGVASEVDRHPGLAQALGVGLALVAQHVVLGGQHHRRRQPGEARRAQRRRVGLGALRVASGT